MCWGSLLWYSSKTGLLHMADRRLEVKSNRHGAFDLLTTTAKLGVHLCVEGAKPPGVLLDYLLQGSGANQHASTWLVHCTTTCAVSKHVTSHIKNQYALCSEGLFQMVYPSNHQVFCPNGTSNKHSWVLQVSVERLCLNVDDDHLSVTRRTEAGNKATQAA